MHGGHVAGPVCGGARPEYALAVLQACRDVFQTEIPHYFLDSRVTGPESVAPVGRARLAPGRAGPHPRWRGFDHSLAGDWFGGWTGLDNGSPDLFITKDLKSGRMVEVIGRGEPALIVCHWPGLYHNGDELGFNIFQEVVARLHARYDNLIWLKLSEIARYWAAKELTRIERKDGLVAIMAPFAALCFPYRRHALILCRNLS